MAVASPGQPVKPGVYRNGANSLRIDPGGKINVRSGDTISKYALCLYGNARIGWQDFGRLVGSKPQPLPNPNLIRIGEELIHIPAFNAEVAKATTNHLGSYQNPVILNFNAVVSKEFVLSRLVDLLYMFLQKGISPITPFEPSSRYVKDYLNRRLTPDMYFAPMDDRSSIWLWTESPNSRKVAIPASRRAQQQFKEVNGMTWEAFRRQNCMQFQWCRPEDHWI